MNTITVRVRWDLLPDDNEIKKAMLRRSPEECLRAAEWNLRKGKKYMAYALTTDDDGIVECARRNLAALTARVAEINAGQID